VRYMARRILTGEWITRDLALTDVESTRTLSGPGTITGNLQPEMNRLLWSDRLRTAEDWATIVYEVDDSDQIANHGIVLPPTSYDDVTRITCAGVASYPNGYIYTGSRLWGPQARVPAKRNKNGKIVRPAQPEIARPDPLVIFGDHWEWIQNQPDSDLGVRLVGDPSTAPVEAQREDYADASEVELVAGRAYAAAQEALKDAQAALERVLKQKDSTRAQKNEARERVEDRRRDLRQAKNAYEAARAELLKFSEGKSKVLIGTYGEPYRLRKWETPDLGSEMDNLAQMTPFEFVEETDWLNAAHTQVDHKIRVGYPRLGRARDDLRFVQGENVPTVPSVQTVEGFANHLIGLGRGEAGPSMVYEEKPWSDGRLRRTRVLTDKTANSDVIKKRLGVYKDILGHRYDVTQVAVIDHPNARISSIQLGDDVRVQADHPEYGEIDLMVRVLSITRGNTYDSAVLTTSAAAFFIYNPSEELS